MRIISFIEEWGVIKAILKHLVFWLVKSKPIPKAHEKIQPVEKNSWVEGVSAERPFGERPAAQDGSSTSGG